MAEHCARCKRRSVLTYQVPEQVKRLVLVGRWKSGVCIACFDELAELARIPYTFENVEATSWSQRPPRRR